MTSNTARKFTIPQTDRNMKIAVRTYKHAETTIVETIVGSTKLHLSDQEATKLAAVINQALNGSEETK